jgi:hypothetical protein
MSDRDTALRILPEKGPKTRSTAGMVRHKIEAYRALYGYDPPKIIMRQGDYEHLVRETLDSLKGSGHLVVEDFRGRPEEAPHIEWENGDFAFMGIPVFWER